MEPLEIISPLSFSLFLILFCFIRTKKFLIFIDNVFHYLFIYFGACWVIVAVCGLSLVAASWDCSSLQRSGFSLQ